MPENLSDHFRSSEFACHHCGLILSPMAAASDLITGLEEIRALLSEFLSRGCPVHVSSGYRCPDHRISLKRRANGQKPSKHTLGLAADIMADVPLEVLATAALSVNLFKDAGVGLYPQENFVHVDIRPDGRARWGVLEGQVVAWAEAVEVLLP